MRIMTRNRFGESPSFRFPQSGVFLLRISAFVLAAMMMAATGAWAQSGKISAKILDAKTGEPLVRAVVQIVQNRMGALTKDNGIATIINVPPDANYTVVA